MIFSNSFRDPFAMVGGVGTGIDLYRLVPMTRFESLSGMYYIS